MNRGAILAVLAIIATAFVIVRLQRVRFRVRSRMSGRPALTCEAFGARYFSDDQAAIADRMREILAHHVPLDLSRLAPEDRLLVDLEMDVLRHGSSFRFFLDLEAEFEIELDDRLLDEDVTMGEIVETIARGRHASQITSLGQTTSTPLRANEDPL